MYYIYILKDINDKIYIGHTSDLKRRLKEHLSRKVFTSRRMDSFGLYYYEAYLDEASAKLRERKLKQYGSAYVGLLKRIGLGKYRGRSLTVE